MTKPNRTLRAALASIALFAPPLAPAQADPAAPPASRPAPKLLVAIAVDQFSADLFAQYRQSYAHGLARLMAGAVFPSAYQSHAATETCPGHSTLLTGVHPARSGVIANDWYDPGIARPDKKIYCAEDERDPASSSKYPVVSAVHLRVPTLGEWMKGKWPASRNVAVSAKDRAVMMMGGHDIDAAFWWRYGQKERADNNSFVTLASRPLAPAAVAENRDVMALIATGAPGFTLPGGCAARQRKLAAGAVSIGAGNFALAAGDFESFRVSPRIDAATLDVAAQLVGAMKLGQRGVPDMLSISLSATDFIGHAYGTEGPEMCIQMAALDAALGDFFARLDRAGIDYAVVLTADHGGLDVPERLAEQGLPSATRVDPALKPEALSAELSAKLGLPATPQLIFAEGPSGDFYVRKSLAAADRARLIAALADRLGRDAQVARAFTHAELAAAPIPTGNPQDYTMLDRARASFDGERSGDVVMLLKRAVVPIPVPTPGYTATHGSAWDYDRRVPLLFWRNSKSGGGMAGLEQPAPVETVDIAPTLAALIGLAVPSGSFDGRCLDIDGSAADSCAGPGAVATAKP